MFIRSLELSDFRNYKSLSIGFAKGTTILYGDNAQGKTNILEAIFLSGTTKSHKASKDRDMIKIGAEESHIRVYIEKNDQSHRIDMHLKKNKTKGIAIDGVSIRKSSELVGSVHLVFFSPEDLSIIKNGPGERRRFIDMELCQLSKVYMHNLTKYNKIVNQRNNLLKQIGFNRELMDTLSIWDFQLLEYGKKIILERESFIKRINQLAANIHNKLSGGKEDLEIRYEPNVCIDEFEKKLLLSRERDLAVKITNTGPHRDDISFQVHDTDIRRFGSQGQQRTSALSLKLAEIEMIKEETGDSPVLLLDDVLSELDRKRQNYLLDSISDIQTIITCTGMEEFINKRIKINQLYQVIDGAIVNQS